MITEQENQRLRQPAGANQCDTQEAKAGYAMAGRPLLSTAGEVEEMFTYHPPSLQQSQHYDTIRGAAKYLAHVIITNAPYCADRTAAIRKLRECVMTANAAIALDGRV